MKRCYLGLLLAFACLPACDKSPQPKATPESVKYYETAVILHGTISDNSGPIKLGTVEAKSVDGKLLAQTTLENTSKYQLSIAAGVALPIVLTFQPDKSVTSQNPMISVVMQASLSKFDINPATTAIAHHAKALGGYTLRNLVQAAEEGVHVPDANKTSTGFRGDPTKQYGGWH